MGRLEGRGMEYLIWSIEHGAWWAPDARGYTASYDKAGRYSKDEAYQISAKANWRALNEVPVPADFFDYQKKCHTAIDGIQTES